MSIDRGSVEVNLEGEITFTFIFIFGRYNLHGKNRERGGNKQFL